MTGFGRKGIDGSAVSAPQRPAGLGGTIRFDVTPHPGKMAMAIVFCGGAGIVVAARIKDPRGLVINHLIELSPFGADIFFGALALCCAGMALAAVFALFRSFGEPVHITMDHHAITAPRYYMFPAMVRLCYHEIAAARLSELKGHQFLVINGRDGRKIRIGSANFRMEDEWPQFVRAIGERLGTA